MTDVVLNKAEIIERAIVEKDTLDIAEFSRRMVREYGSAE